MEWGSVANWPLAELRLDLLFRLVLAAALGGAIGLERERSGKPAGFRTNMLICVGAALLTEISVLFGMRGELADPGRVAAQIVSGIGFLGAGTIIQARGSVLGLTTAATLWVVAAIGMAVGASAYIEAIGTTVLVILALAFLGRLETRLFRRWTEEQLRLTLAADAELLQKVQGLMVRAGYTVELLELERSEQQYVASFLVGGPGAGREELMRDLLEVPSVSRISHR